MLAKPTGSPMADCTATILVHDDRWGGFVNHCELPANHDGEHQRTLRACEPIARMVWLGEYDGRTDG